MRHPHLLLSLNPNPSLSRSPSLGAILALSPSWLLNLRLNHRTKPSLRLNLHLRLLLRLSPKCSLNRSLNLKFSPRLRLRLNHSPSSMCSLSLNLCYTRNRRH